MLVFGLAVIFLFIRLHGSGYDFPVAVARCRDKLDFPRKPDRTFMEASKVYHDHFRDWSADYIGSEESKNYGQKFMAGWNSQWHLNKKKSKQSDPAAASNIGSDSVDDTQQWIWMTNIWHDDGNCGPAWDLMYIHKFPGIITHSSLSKRLVPRSPTGGDAQEKDGATSVGQLSREDIRLAIVYKVAQDEDVTYYSRVYHFGVFQDLTDLRDCKSKSTETETCHVHEPFMNYDYVLPGSTPIKDFTLEHDVIIYSRLSDTVAFRSLKLPRLEPGSTSFQHPYVLPSGASGVPLDCTARRNVPFRKSYLARVPSGPESDDFHVLIGQVQEYESNWIYQVDIESQTTDVNTGNRKWQENAFPWRVVKSKLTVQEPDMIDEEPHVYGVPVQRPFIIKSVDGSSFHIPVADGILSLETMSQSRTFNYRNDARPNDGRSAEEQEQDRDGIPTSQQLQKQKSDREHHQSTSSFFKDQWSKIDSGSIASMDAEYGIINDKGNILVLKTTRNGVLILKRNIDGPTSTPDNSLWRLTMGMDDDNYNPLAGNNAERDVLAMKIIRALVPVPEELDENPDVAGDKHESDIPVLYTQDSNEHHINGDSDSPSETKGQKMEMHNVLGRFKSPCI
ncbi:hypothetical protein BGX27_006239 [Mortierella sp. AM989]|nr:hypothetical protein BGX27_006239 [Mortierella sp. AM989]